MQTVEVRILGKDGRANRALYLGRDVSGADLSTNPFLAEAIAAWQAGGCRNDVPVLVSIHAEGPDPKAAEEAPADDPAPEPDPEPESEHEEGDDDEEEDD